MWNKMKGLIAEHLSLLVAMLIGINPQEYWADTVKSSEPKVPDTKGGASTYTAAYDIESNGLSSMQHGGVPLLWPSDRGADTEGETRDG